MAGKGMRPICPAPPRASIPGQPPETRPVAGNHASRRKPCQPLETRPAAGNQANRPNVAANPLPVMARPRAGHRSRHGERFRAHRPRSFLRTLVVPQPMARSGACHDGERHAANLPRPATRLDTRPAAGNQASRWKPCQSPETMPAAGNQASRRKPGQSPERGRQPTPRHGTPPSGPSVAARRTFSRTPAAILSPNIVCAATDGPLRGVP